MADWRSVWRAPSDDWTDGALVDHMQVTAMGYNTRALDLKHLTDAREALQRRFDELRKQIAELKPKD